MCVGCDSPFTVEHISVDCIEFVMSRSKYFNVSSLDELFDTLHSRDLIDFIKELSNRFAPQNAARITLLFESTRVIIVSYTYFFILHVLSFLFITLRSSV
jgi:hypothetical protein